ncbi:hypothetical protein C8J57DRAFT_1250244 [Mycena rebaudengoi]|nr:hypothetical protein C8J57DRAFT_1250244 [Mycena rebaudengoi]
MARFLTLTRHENSVPVHDLALQRRVSAQVGLPSPPHRLPRLFTPQTSLYSKNWPYRAHSSPLAFFCEPGCPLLRTHAPVPLDDPPHRNLCQRSALAGTTVPPTARRSAAAMDSALHLQFAALCRRFGLGSEVEGCMTVFGRSGYLSALNPSNFQLRLYSPLYTTTPPAGRLLVSPDILVLFCALGSAVPLTHPATLSDMSPGPQNCSSIAIFGSAPAPPHPHLLNLPLTSCSVSATLSMVSNAQTPAIDTLGLRLHCCSASHPADCTSGARTQVSGGSRPLYFRGTSAGSTSVLPRMGSINANSISTSLPRCTNSATFAAFRYLDPGTCLEHGDLASRLRRASIECAAADGITKAEFHEKLPTHVWTIWYTPPIDAAGPTQAAPATDVRYHQN